MSYFIDSTTVIEHLDRISLVATSIGHFAAGMSEFMWPLNRCGTCWRWLLKTGDSP